MYIIKGGTVVTAADRYVADVAVEGEKIVQIAASIDPNGGRVVDARGCYVFPGGIDPHTHFDMPFGGTVTADDFESGTRAAAAGGTTTVIDFAMQEQGASLRDALATWHQKADGRAVIDYAFHIGVVDAREEVAAELPALVEDEGVTSLKLFLAYKGSLMSDDSQVYRMLAAARRAGVLVQFHCENGEIIDALVREALRAGRTAPVHHARTRPSVLEAEATSRAIALAELTGAAIYIVHVSCAGAAEVIAAARHRGVAVWGETCPQYLLLDESLYELPGFEGAKYVMSPPLRTPADQEGLWKALQRGDLQLVGSDHCSFSMQGSPEKPQKELGLNDFSKIPNGAPGAEDRFALLYTHGVAAGRLSLNHFVDLVATRAAKVFGLFPRKGTIAVGSDADLVVWDPSVTRTISARSHQQNVGYNAYEGFEVRGQATHVLSRGRLVVDGGRVEAEPGSGRYQRCRPYGETW